MSIGRAKLPQVKELFKFTRVGLHGLVVEKCRDPIDVDHDIARLPARVGPL